MTLSRLSITRAVSVPRRSPVAPLSVRALAATRGRAAGILGLVVGASFVVRLFAAWRIRTPVLLPDEYIYSSLAHSIVETGTPAVRGASPHFPALLQPILISPFWLGDNIELSYRLTQAFQALAMSLAIVPVYVLARWLGARRWLAVGIAIFAVSLPDLLYAGYLLTEAIAYPLVLVAALLAVRALERPTRGRQLLFVLGAGAAAFTRIQFVALFAAFFVAALAGQRFRPKPFVRRFAPSLLVVVVPVAVYFGLKGKSGLGYYSTLTSYRLYPLELLHWTGLDAMLLAYASMFALVPAALVALLAGALRPRSPRERAYSQFVLALTVFLFIEAILYATNGTQRYQQRYLFSLIPLLALGFPLFLGRGRRLRIPALGLAALLLVLSMWFPLSSYTVADKAQDSLFLTAVAQLISQYGNGDGSLIVALVAAPLLALGAGAVLRPRIFAPLALGAAIAAGGACSYLAVERMTAKTKLTESTFFAHDRRIADDAFNGSVALVNAPAASRLQAFELLFWNRRLDRVVQLPGANPIDDFGHEDGRIAPDGRLLVGGRAYNGPLLVMLFGSQAEVDGAQTVARHSNWVLLRPRALRFSSLTYGLYFDRWLSGRGWTAVWPDGSGRVDGVLRYRLTLPTWAPEPDRIVFRAPGYRRSIVVRPGRTTVVQIPIHRARRTTVSWRMTSPILIILQGRVVCAQASVTFLRGATGTAAG